MEQSAREAIVFARPAKSERVLSVPLTRYFICVGGALLALLFVANWLWSNPSPMPSYGSPIDETIVRIQSKHKWPQKVELDTTTPIIAPLSSAPLAETALAEAAIPPAPKPALDALSRANPPQKHVARRKSVAHGRSRNPNGLGELRFAVNPTPQAWPNGW